MSVDTTAAAPEEKSGEKSGNGRFVGGAADPRAGRGPKKGAKNAGRPPLAFSEQCKALQRGPIMRKVAKVINDKTKGPKDQEWQWATAYVSKYGEKEIAKRVEHGGLDGGPILLEQVLIDRRKEAQGE